MLYLDAGTQALVKRYDATRRKHPLDGEAPGLVEAIELEREMLQPVRDAADLVIDTSELNVHQLKAKLLAAFDSAGDGQRLVIAVESFGFKHGLPIDSDIVMDVRFLPNPHWEEALRPLTGHDPLVRDFVLTRPEAEDFLDRFEALMLSILPSYEGGGQELPHRLDRVHRWPAPQRGRRRGTCAASARPRICRTHRPRFRRARGASRPQPLGLSGLVSGPRRRSRLDM